MVGRKVDNVQGSSSICRVRRVIYFRREYAKWFLGFIVNVMMNWASLSGIDIQKVVGVVLY